jgi:hypothetical protein
MAIKIRNRYNEIVDLLSTEGKVHMLSNEESYALSEAVNSEMRTFRREYQRKARESYNAASTIILTS